MAPTDKPVVLTSKASIVISRLRSALAQLLVEYEDVPDATDADGQALFQEARNAIAAADRYSGETRVSPAEDFWMRLLADVNAEPCRWPGLRNELRDWQRTVRGSQKARASPNDAVRWICGECSTVNSNNDLHCCVKSCKGCRPFGWANAESEGEV